ncbi:MAG: hypothetical protein J0I06_01435 [Planctomycetes bacterium]|nr:hypothetical protein [Planctomycetota bacterium]
MVKRARKAQQPAAPRRVRPVLAVLLTLGVAAAVLFGLVRLGDEARRHIGPRDRYAVKFADIRCDPPPGATRDTFLAEVRYAADVPPTFQALDSELVTKLSAAFAAHPWVASVDAVTVNASDEVSVKLTYRRPVLAVPAGGAKRAVDAKGIVLPASAPTADLPELLTATPLALEAVAGKPWPDEAVVRAAPVAAEYKPKTIERTPQGWQLVMPDGKKLMVAGR